MILATLHRIVAMFQDPEWRCIRTPTGSLGGLYRKLPRCSGVPIRLRDWAISTDSVGPALRGCLGRVGRSPYFPRYRQLRGNFRYKPLFLDRVAISQGPPGGLGVPDRHGIEECKRVQEMLGRLWPFIDLRDEQSTNWLRAKNCEIRGKSHLVEAHGGKDGVAEPEVPLPGARPKIPRTDGPRGFTRAAGTVSMRCLPARRRPGRSETRATPPGVRAGRCAARGEGTGWSA